MNEYMLLIRNLMNSKESFSPEMHTEFINACRDHIGDLKARGQLLAAQPLIREGVLLSGNAGAWEQAPFNEREEVQVGYYHILAHSLDEAVEIAKNNPEFRYTNTARVEVRPVKINEQATGFKYPGQGEQ
jgi:hypothetical protein